MEVRRKGRCRLSTSLLMLPMLAACGLTSNQEKGVRSFATAASAVSEVAVREIPRMRERLIAINRDLYVLAPTSHGLMPDEQVLGVNVRNFDGSLDPGVVKAMLQAADGLVGYAEVLKAIVDYDTEAELKQAADKLSESIKGVQIDGEALLSDDDVDAIAGVIRELGGWYVESKKKAAVVKIAKAYVDPVKKLCAQLQQDFDPTNADGGVAGTLFTRAKDLLVAARLAHASAGTIAERQAALAGMDRAEAALREFAVVFGQVSKACNGLVKANDNMVAVLANQELDQQAIKDFYDSVKELVDNIRVLSE